MLAKVFFLPSHLYFNFPLVLYVRLDFYGFVLFCFFTQTYPIGNIIRILTKYFNLIQVRHLIVRLGSVCRSVMGMICDIGKNAW